MDDYERQLSGIDADALLFVGKSASLTNSPVEPSVYLDPAYRREIDRRHQGILNSPLPNSAAETNPMSPQYMHHY